MAYSLCLHGNSKWESSSHYGRGNIWDFFKSVTLIRAEQSIQIFYQTTSE